MFFCRPRQNPRYLNVNEILDLLDDDETHNVEAIYISPPDGDVSDGYDESDTEDANPDCLSKAVLTSRVLEVQSRGEPLLEEEVGNPEEEGEEDVQTSGAEKRARVARDEWKWEKKTISFNSRQPPPPFPDGNYTAYKNMSAKDLVDLFFTDEMLETIAASSNGYWGTFNGGESPNVTISELKVFFAILLLSGYSYSKNPRNYWSNLEDTQNMLVKKAMTRDSVSGKRCRKKQC